jgi:membrane protease YdiL (CAAX protease family)
MFVALFSFLPPYRVLMTWVFDRTGSTLVAILMHASLTTSMLLFGSTATGDAAVVYDAVFAGVLWAVVLASRALRSRAHRDIADVRRRLLPN